MPGKLTALCGLLVVLCAGYLAPVRPADPSPPAPGEREGLFRPAEGYGAYTWHMKLKKAMKHGLEGWEELRPKEGWETRQRAFMSLGELDRQIVTVVLLFSEEKLSGIAFLHKVDCTPEAASGRHRILSERYGKPFIQQNTGSLEQGYKAISMFQQDFVKITLFYLIEGKVQLQPGFYPQCVMMELYEKQPKVPLFGGPAPMNRFGYPNLGEPFSVPDYLGPPQPLR